MDIDDIRLFCRVARAESFSAAARSLNLSPAAVSLAVKRIESTCRVRLFERSTRVVRLTAEGETFLAGCESTLATWEEALAALGSHGEVLTGELHIAAPTDLTHQHLGNWIADWRQAHPLLRVSLHVADRVHDIRRESVDIAIRYGALPDSSLVAHVLCTGPRVAVASPDYLARCGVPETLDDLRKHVGVFWHAGDKPFRNWHFWRGRRKQGEGEIVRMNGELCADGSLARRWAIEGRGIAFKVLWDVIDDLEAQRLVQVVPKYRGEEIPVHAVLPSRAHQPPRVRAALKYLIARFKELQKRMDRAYL